MKRAIRFVVAALLVLAIPIPASASTEPIFYYPNSDGFPSASLKTTAPSYSGPMWDIDGNGKQGRRVDKSDEGLAETDSDKYQQWSIDASGLQVTGSAALTIWYAAKDFNGGDTNRLVAYLLDCGSSGCSTLATASKDVTVPDGENVFSQTTLTFPSFNHTFSSGRSLRLRIMIDEDFSDDDMTFAYDTTNYVTRLKLTKVVPPPTTTTTTSTTSTTSTTTTTTAPTTTSTSPTTTSTATGSSSTSTTVENASSSTSTTVAEVTVTSNDDNSGSTPATSPTTTLPPPPPPEEQDLDTEKTNLVVKTTPAQRGVRVSSETVELSPVEGLMVSFTTAAETVQRNLLSSAGLGVVMAGLLLIGMRNRQGDEEYDPDPRSGRIPI